MTQAHSAGPIPDHVPPHLIEPDFPLVSGHFTLENPFDRIVPEACEGPDIVYVPNMMHGGRAHSWVLRRHDDIQAVYHDVEHFSNRDFSALGKLIGETWDLVPAEQDAPQHTFYRQLLNPIFSPGAMARMDDVVRKAAQDCLAGIEGRTSCDYIHDFAFPFPVGVVLDLMDLPRARMREFQEWEMMIIQSGDLDTIKRGIKSIADYLRGVIEERKANPGSDLISIAITAEVNGRRMNDDELMGYAFNFYLGGLDTVTAHTANFVRHLATHPDQQRYLRENPAQIRTAVEEFMRAFAAVTTYRTCSKETRIRGVTIKPGDRVAMITTLAGRDGQVYDDPHSVRLDRNPRHLSFAVGPHHCLGVHLARRELRIALEETFKAIPEFRLDPDVPIESQAGVIIQPRNLPLVWG
ncbi:MAG: cytochrome P450 [Porticoccaceae bacterium]|jgi:cytochrome P450|nr:cytochrome P450 [Porticoccaceae bacterium]MEA3301389.1 cytochrome P450 [Pseudomonadota bacterium]